MRRHSLNFYLFFFLVVSISQCKEPYELDKINQAGVLVIDGNISDMPGPYILSIGKTKDSKNPPTPILGASASISDDHGYAENYLEIGNGKYQLNGIVVQGTAGRSYTLHIILPNGSTYQSRAEIMPVYSKPKDSLFFKVVETPQIVNGVEIKNMYVNIYLNTSFEDTKAGYFRWSVGEAYSILVNCNICPNCIVYPPLSYYNLNVLNLADYNQKSIQGIQVISRGVDYTFATRHFFNVTQVGMNSSAFAYWKGVQQLITDIGTIFQAPPYTIKGNITNVNNANELVAGYFEASTKELKRIPVDRGYIHTIIPTCSPSITIADPLLLNPDICANCLVLPGSTTEIPDWFWR